MKPPHLAPYVQAGDLFYLSGQLPFDETGKIVTDDLGEQTTQTLRNIERVLAGIGLSRDHIVKATVWLVPGSDFATFNDRYADFFGDHKPARSTVFSGLALPAAKVEIEVIAHRA